MKNPLILGKSYIDLYILEKCKDTSTASTTQPDTTLACLNKGKNSVFNRSANSVNANTWHQRLGHLLVYKLKSLPFVDFDDKTFLHSCEICAKARQHRLSFPHSKINSDRPFQLLHVDV